MTTSSSFPKISDIFPAIHLRGSQQKSEVDCLEAGREHSSLFHDLNVHLLHVHLLVELWGELRLLQQLGIGRRHRHFGS